MAFLSSAPMNEVQLIINASHNQRHQFFSFFFNPEPGLLVITACPLVWVAESGTNCYAAATTACGGLWQPKVVLSDWQLSQHWLFYGWVNRGGVAAKYA
jgi:hypothetical protein